MTGILYKRANGEYEWTFEATQAFKRGLDAEVNWRLIATGNDAANVVLTVLSAPVSLVSFILLCIYV